MAQSGDNPRSMRFFQVVPATWPDSGQNRAAGSKSGCVVQNWVQYVAVVVGGAAEANVACASGVAVWVFAVGGPVLLGSFRPPAEAVVAAAGFGIDPGAIVTGIETHGHGFGDAP